MIMTLQFDATIDDVVDVTIRSLAGSKSVRTWRWQGAAVTGLMLALPGYFLFAYTVGVGRRIAGVAALVAALIGAGVHVWTYEDAARKRVRTLCREQIGTDRPFTVTVELSEAGISLGQMGAQTLYDWSSIEIVEETEDALYFYRTDSGCFAVRKRGFESVASKDEFLKLAENNIQRSRGLLCSKS